MTETTRIQRAACSCGAVSVSVTGAPVFQAVCACSDCKSRTGSAFGMTAFYPRDRVTTAGTPTVYRRKSDAGRTLDFRFCPICGTSVWWEVAVSPDMIGVAGALIEGLAFAPDLAVWCQGQPDFVALPEGLRQHQRGSLDG